MVISSPMDEDDKPDKPLNKNGRLTITVFAAINVTVLVSRPIDTAWTVIARMGRKGAGCFLSHNRNASKTARPMPPV
ncbi:hypothetical protein GCM10010918_53240 [Paenibacillus radicis (ex Gao et al. 2016)]|uniref:Uncharacterized protein n=1 Tax=Paenibacillus radicis (ex Gao et al. 2016) TaxID=1737354 RepID=A0A917MAJ6_9BACL|nr:hypothetical protein GCM10010918_53240 [Paenibacillus radicis (ex Gao et al. 2016)]